MTDPLRGSYPATDVALLPCPFCGGAMMFRKALWPSDGNVDAVIHAAPVECWLSDFYDMTTDESIIAKWNHRTDGLAQTPVYPGSDADRRKERVSMAREICLHRGENPNFIDRSGNETWEKYEPLAGACIREAERLFGRRTGGVAQAGQVPRVAERLADVVMMLDAPDAYNREYIAAVCRSILSSVPSTEIK